MITPLVLNNVEQELQKKIQKRNSKIDQNTEQ